MKLGVGVFSFITWYKKSMVGQIHVIEIITG